MSPRPWQHGGVRDAVIIGFSVVLGALVGSFLNVVLYRVPRHESVVYPGSHCPNCDTPLQWYELVPVLSWVALRGRCRTCHTSISVRYPLVELACAVVAGLVAWLIVG
jgi:prepilin signal peptidase PulO-like enzyme (type II secretory pathway)